MEKEILALKIILILSITDMLAHGRPISHGLTLKLNPILVKDDVVPNTFDAFFSKIHQEETKEAVKRKFVTKAFVSQTDLSVNSTKPIAKVVFPSKQGEDINGTETIKNSINIPIIPQPYPDYKIVVATAPWNVRIGGDDAKPAVIYIVFPEDNTDSNSLKIPSIYFVRKPSGVLNLEGILNKRDRIDPVIIVDNNRTVTGLRSNEIPKFVRFKTTKEVTCRERYCYHDMVATFKHYFQKILKIFESSKAKKPKL